jgi:heme-degrading monooxygenase HmoA
MGTDLINQERNIEMIARVWKGWTKVEKANAYEKLLREVVYPGLEKIGGYRGGYILRQDGKDETEFVTVNLFESIEAVKAFAGPQYETPVFEPEARRLLSRVESNAQHYDVRKAPQQ